MTDRIDQEHTRVQHRVKVPISIGMLTDYIGAPETSEIVGIVYQPADGIVEIVLSDPGFPAQPWDTALWVVSPEFIIDDVGLATAVWRHSDGTTQTVYMMGRR